MKFHGPIKNWLRVIGIYWVAVYLVLVANCSSSAQAASGITVSPAIVNLSIAPEETQATTSFNITNGYSQATQIVIRLLAAQNNEQFFNANSLSAKQLASAISIQPATFDLSPKQAQKVNVTVLRPDLLRPGGNYATLLIRRVNSPSDNIGLNSEIMLNVFIDKEAGARRDLSLIDVHYQQWLLGSPDSVVINLKNNGNVKLVPRGIVLIADQSAKNVYQKGTINDTSIPVFPGRELSLEVDLKKLLTIWLPKQLNLSVQYRFDGSATIQSHNRQLLIVPHIFWPILAAAFSVLIFLGKCIRHRFKAIKTINH